ncbi:MAG: acyl-CoA desaturase [Rhodoferax sp.]
MGFLDWAAHGLLGWGVWQWVAVTLVFTHLTMVSVTVFLHRHQAHRALDLHPVAAHAFRFWLWLTTGLVTREWTSVHRKHHARCEQAQDPHSPRVYGIRTVLLRGAELYRAEARNPETLARYGHGTPDDWLERHVYGHHSYAGIALMLGVDLALFGVAGLTIWAVQMLWTPVMAAGIINGLGHFWGYRNFESPDASTNLVPWGIVIAGEELHNNHHTYPTSAKLSVKPYEFDIGWVYIRALAALGLARVKKTPPRLNLGPVRSQPDAQTLDALISHRFELMAGYAKAMRRAVRQELSALRAQRLDARVLRAARRWLHRDMAQVPAEVLPQLAQARSASRVLDQWVAMREELRQLWINRAHTREELIAELQTWCQNAEACGIAALREFSLRVRALRA